MARLLLVLLLAAPLLAQDLLVSALGTGAIHRYDGLTGEFRSLFVENVPGATGMAFGPDGNLYVSLIDRGDILRFDGRTGAPLGRFVFDDPSTPADETGGSRGARSLLFAADGNLYVAAGGEAEALNRVLRFDGRTGRFLDVFAQGQGMRGITSLAFGPDGDLYVAGALSNEVYVFRGGSGEFLRKFTCGDANRNLTGLLFLRDGSLLATASDRGAILRYSPSGECLGTFTSAGLSVPISVIYGRDGNLLVASLLTHSVVRVDATTGQAAGAFVPRGRGGLAQPHSLVFMPAERPGPRRRAISSSDLRSGGDACGSASLARR